MTPLRKALFIPPVDELCDVRLLVRLSVEAEEAGWEGVFLWDHIMRPERERPVADPWVALGAIAYATTTVRLGTMVTPLVRRRPAKLAREVGTLDVLSGGRVTLGLGLGVDTGRELSAFDEVTDAIERGDMLDEGLVLLRELLTGRVVNHSGRFYTADDVVLHPASPQQPVPIWMAARSLKGRPLRRAASVDGLFPIEVSPDDLRSMLAVIADHRESMDGFDVVVLDSADNDVEAWADAGATWRFADIQPGASGDDVRRIIAAG